MKKLLMLLAVVGLVGMNAYGRRRKAVPAVTSQWTNAVTIDDSQINFIKSWYMQITPDVVLEVEATYKPWLDTNCARWCSFSFTLRQGSNRAKWVDFNCDAVAERIVRMELVPVAEKNCKILRAQAIQYWGQHADPNEFMDVKGRVWRRDSK